MSVCVESEESFLLLVALFEMGLEDLGALGGCFLPQGHSSKSLAIKSRLVDHGFIIRLKCQTKEKQLKDNQQIIE